MSKCKCNCKNNTTCCKSKSNNQVGYFRYKRIRDLPEDERVEFTKWLTYQTVPMDDSIPLEEQDFYYQHDYDKWKQLLKVKQCH